MAGTALNSCCHQACSSTVRRNDCPPSTTYRIHRCSPATLIRQRHDAHALAPSLACRIVGADWLRPEGEYVFRRGNKGKRGFRCIGVTWRPTMACHGIVEQESTKHQPQSCHKSQHKTKVKGHPLNFLPAASLKAMDDIIIY